MGLTQASRAARKEFPPERYHTTYRPEVEFDDWPKYMKAFPFMASHLDFDIAALLRRLDAGSKSPIDILPLIKLDWTKQPYSIYQLRNPFTMINKPPSPKRSMHITFYLIRYSYASGLPLCAPDLDLFKSISLACSVGLISLVFVLKDELRSVEDLETKRKAMDRILDYSKVMLNGDVRAVCESGGYTFCAEGKKGSKGAMGYWTKWNRRVGPVRHYY